MSARATHDVRPTIGYNISFANATGNPFMLAFGLMLVALISLVPVLLSPESARRPLDERFTEEQPV